VQRAILPPLSLAGMLAHWPQLARQLAERPRRRKTQLEKLHEIS
jgi:hypothetical protein